MRTSTKTLGAPAMFLLLLVSSTSKADCHFFAAAGSQITPRDGNCKGVENDPKNGLERCYHGDHAERQISELTYADGKRTGKMAGIRSTTIGD